MKIGQHFTPDDLADKLISDSAKRWPKKSRISICDPACGDGQILLAAKRYCDANEINAEYHGFDLDPVAADQCMKNIPSAKIKVCDFLTIDAGSLEFGVFVGNPPFLGGNKISSTSGSDYLKTLKKLYPGPAGDYNAYFLRAMLKYKPIVISTINTNTIAQGKTRALGLQFLVKNGYNIYCANKNIKWPGDAAVTVSTVHLAKGQSIDCVKDQFKLDHKPVSIINSRLNPRPERKNPHKLEANRNKSFQGSIVLGMGFTLTPEEREALIAKNKHNGELIFPYIGGEEVNTSPTQAFHRYVINFGQMPLQEAEQCPDLLDIVRHKVKPERDKASHSKGPWWQFERIRPELYKAIQPLSRCLVTLFTTKHLTFSFLNVDRVFANSLWIFPFSQHLNFAILQSRIHEVWARLLSSTMEDRLRYAATNCFETFPFPALTKTSAAALDKVGKTLYELRAAYMVNTNQGLTQTYNALKDPDNQDAKIVQLRQLHQEMDQVVLDAYGWSDLVAPPFGAPVTDDEKAALQVFSEEVIERLFVLNEEQYKQKKLNCRQRSIFH